MSRSGVEPSAPPRRSAASASSLDKLISICNGHRRLSQSAPRCRSLTSTDHASAWRVSVAEPTVAQALPGSELVLRDVQPAPVLRRAAARLTKSRARAGRFVERSRRAGVQVLRLSHTRVLAVRVAAAGRRLPRPGPPSSAASSPLRRDPSAPTSPTASWCTRQVRPSEPSATCASARPPVSRSFRPAGPDASRSTRTIGGNGGPSGRNATSVAAALAREGVSAASRILRPTGCGVALRRNGSPSWLIGSSPGTPSPGPPGPRPAPRRRSRADATRFREAPVPWRKPPRSTRPSGSLGVRAVAGAAPAFAASSPGSTPSRSNGSAQGSESRKPASAIDSRAASCDPSRHDRP